MSLNTTFAAGDVLTAAHMNGLQSAWTAWTPTWSAATTGPTVGNGSLTGRYHRIGKTVSFTVVISMGSTTTYGVGGWGLTLPVPLVGSIVNNQFIAAGNAFDISANLNHPIAAINFGGGLFLAKNDGNLVGATSPFTWASGDVLSIGGSYEAA